MSQVLQPHRGELHRVDLHAHRRLLLPADGHLRNARQLRELPRDHGLRAVIHLRDGHDVRVHRQDQDRGIGRVDLRRPAAPAGSSALTAAAASIPRLHVLRGRVDIACRG